MVNSFNFEPYCIYFASSVCLPAVVSLAPLCELTANVESGSGFGITCTGHFCTYHSRSKFLRGLKPEKIERACSSPTPFALDFYALWRNNSC